MWNVSKELISCELTRGQLETCVVYFADNFRNLHQQEVCLKAAIAIDNGYLYPQPKIGQATKWRRLRKRSRLAAVSSRLTRKVTAVDIMASATTRYSPKIKQ